MISGKNVLFQTVVLPLLFLGVTTNDDSSERYVHSRVCLDKGCIIAAATLLTNMNTTAVPCDNFYDYSCGRFYEEQPLTYRKPLTSTLDIRFTEYIAEIKALLEAPKRFSDSESLRKAKDFYNSCMISDTVTEIQSLKDFTEQSLGDIPILAGDYWHDDNFNWQDLVTFLLKNGFQNIGLFAVRIENSHELAFEIEFQLPALRVLFERNESKISETLMHFAKKELDSEIANSTAKLTKEVDDIIEVLHSIKKVSMMFKKVTEYTIEDLQEKIPNFDWKNMFQQIARKHLSSKTKVSVEGMTWLTQIMQIADKANARTMANYLIINALGSLFVNNELSLHLQKAGRSYLNKVLEIEEEPYEPETLLTIFCTKFAARITNAVKAAHYKYYIDSEKQEKHIIEMARLIYTTFYQNYSHVFPTSMQSLIQINNTKIIIGVRPKYLDEINVDETYNSLSSHWTSFISNVLALKRFKNAQATIESGNESNEGIVLPDVAVKVNTQTKFLEIDIPSSLLRGITFAKDRPQSFNFGTLGFKISEGLIKFAQQHRDSDIPLMQYVELNFMRTKPPENIYNVFPQTVKDLKSFQGLSQITKKMIVKTLIESYRALELTFSAYQEWLNQTETDTNLPTVEPNGNKLFWLGYATLHCAAENKAYSKFLPYYIENLTKMIVLSVVQFSTDFAESFQCSDTFLNKHYTEVFGN